MRKFMVLRGSMVPYIYTYSREALILVLFIIKINELHVPLGLTLLRALYFEYPEADESYLQVFKNQVSFWWLVTLMFCTITLVFFWSSHYGSSYY